MSEGLDGVWAGNRCFVIGGGPSLRGFDFSRLKWEFAVGTNMAFLHRPTVNLVFDLRLMERLQSDERWVGYRGAKMWLNSEVRAPGRFPGVRELKECVDERNMPRWSRSLSDGLWRRTNAGASALNLAEILGADPIYLLGFDFDKPGNWHEEYPEPERPEPELMRGYLADFQDNFQNVRAKVVNLNPDSMLRCFSFASVDDVLGAPAGTP